MHGARALIAHEPDVGRHPGNARRRERRQAARTIHYRRTAVPELDACERPVPVDGVHRQRMRAHVVLVPQSRERQRRIVRARVNRHGARAYHAPAAFRLRLAKARAHVRQRVRHATRVGNLIEAIRRGHRTDSYRIEQHRISRVHGGQWTWRVLRSLDSSCFIRPRPLSSASWSIPRD